MKLTSIQLKILIVLISVLSISTVVYFFSAEDDVLPKMTVQEKKARFKKLIIPAIDTVYAKLMTRYQQISESIKSGNITDEIKKLKVEYKATSNEEL
ncbi:MAG: Bax protein, partial [Paraglaciecola sp.]